MVLLENVRGIEIEFGRQERQAAPKRGRRPEAHSKRIRRRLEELGYAVFTTEVRAVDCGVPQQRPRFILAGVRRDAVAPGRTIPDPFASGGIFEQQRLAFLAAKGLPADHPVSVREALSDLETRGEGGTTRGMSELAEVQAARVQCPADPLPEAPATGRR